MNAKDAIRIALKTNHEILKMFLSDLSDADLLVRPVPGANHIAWQLGHLVSTEGRFQTMVPGGTPVELPAGFDKQHNKETAAADAPAGRSETRLRNDSCAASPSPCSSPACRSAGRRRGNRPIGTMHRPCRSNCRTSCSRRWK